LVWNWSCDCTCGGTCDGEPCEGGGGGGGGSNDYMSGMIWEDKNENGVYDLDEEFKGESQLTCSSYLHTEFQVRIDGKNRARDWLCWGGNQNIPINRQAYWWSGSDAIGWGGDAHIPNGVSLYAELLGLPSGYTCKSWQLYNCPSDVCDATPSYSGTGCSAVFWKNHQARLNWEIGPCTPTDGTLSAWSTCSSPCGPGTQTATCTKEATCGGTTCSTLCSNAGGTYNSTTKICTRSCNLGPCNQNPKGVFDSVSCGSDPTSPNFHKIRVRGWACDPDNYSSPIDVHVYNGTSSSGTKIGSGTANLPGELAIGSQCGGTTSHRFDILSTGTFAPGTYSINTYGINTPPGTNPLLSQSPRSVTCCAPTNGSLGVWGTCTGGTHVSTCVGFDCGGNCSAECSDEGGTYNYSTHVCTRNCLRLDGNIWSDDDGDGKELSDYWKRDLNSPFGCGTSKTFSNFYMTISGETPPNQIVGWFCHSNPLYGTYYNSPVPNAIEPETTKSVTLSSIPQGYKFVSWQYITQENGGSVVREGSGSSATNLLMPSSGWVNVHWKLAQEKYNLKLKVREIPPEESATPSLCSSSKFNTFDVMPGADVTIKNSIGSTTLCSGTSNSEGDFTCPIWTHQGKVLIEVSKYVGGSVPETYTMQCPAVNQYSYEPPSPPSDGATINLNIGLQTIYKKGWVSAIDADIFANELNVTVPDGPTNNSSPGQIYQGFAKTLINSSFNNNNYLGFIFSQSDDISNPDIERGCPSKKGFETNTSCDTEYGGYAYDLMHFGQEHKSIWLENFDFSPPSSAETLDSLPNTFVAGGIYQISSDIFNERLGSGSDYSYTITSSGGEGIAILYVNGNSEINVNINTTSTSKGRLLLVINGSLTIGSNVGTSITSFQMSGNPNIMAGIIAKDQITFQSRGGSISPSNFDKPVMVSAPLVSKAGISFKRDLYHDNNAVIPAESAKFFGKYLYYISSLEREKSSSHLYYTGVSTYDLDWEYIY
jgi:hypothetical protein